MGKKEVTVCDYCGCTMDEVRTDRMNDISMPSTLVNVGALDGITMTFEYVEHGKVVELHHWVEELDACNTFHLSLAIKRIGEGLVKEYKETLAEGMEDIPCKIHLSDITDAR